MRSVIALLLLCVPLPARVLELGFPKLEHRVQVSFPDNHEAEKQFPAIFYYHGTNGRPDTSLMRSHAGPDDWFVVGMPYVQKGKFNLSPETLADELQVLRSVIRHLGAKHGLDQKRVYVAGFSKGGWVSGFLLQRDRSLAGAVILGAGHVHRVKSAPAKLARPTPVFLGVGRKDGNYPFTLRAITFFRGLGADTTFETWHGLDHNFPRDGSPALRQWLQARILPPAKLRFAATAWSVDRLGELAAMADPVDRWVAHLDAEQAPYFRLLDEVEKAKFVSTRRALERTAAVKPEVECLVRHRKLLRKESNNPSKEDYRKLSASYEALAQSANATRQGGLALDDHRRVERLLLHFAEEEKIREADREPFGPESNDGLFSPDPPNDRRLVPKNPLVK